MNNQRTTNSFTMEKDQTLPQIPLAHLTATAEILANENVYQENFRLIRTDRNVAKNVARILTKRHVIDEAVFHGHFGGCILDRMFGASSWFSFLDIRLWEDFHIPPIPNKIYHIMNEDCCFWRKKKVMDTHFLFLAPCDKNEKIVIPRQANNFLFSKELIKENTFTSFERAFKNVNGKLKLNWYLLPIDGIPSTFSETLKCQYSLLPKNYTVANETEEILKIVFYQLLVDEKKEFKLVRSLKPDKVSSKGIIEFNNLSIKDQVKIWGMVGANSYEIHEYEDMEGYNSKMCLSAKRLLV